MGYTSEYLMMIHCNLVRIQHNFILHVHLRAYVMLKNVKTSEKIIIAKTQVHDVPNCIMIYLC